MNVSLKGNEQITKLLNDWYVEIRARRIENAHHLKDKIASIMCDIQEDQNLLLFICSLTFVINILLIT